MICDRGGVASGNYVVTDGVYLCVRHGEGRRLTPEQVAPRCRMVTGASFWLSGIPHAAVEYYGWEHRRQLQERGGLDCSPSNFPRTFQLGSIQTGVPDFPDQIEECWGSGEDTAHPPIRTMRPWLKGDRVQTGDNRTSLSLGFSGCCPPVERRLRLLCAAPGKKNARHGKGSSVPLCLGFSRSNMQHAPHSRGLLRLS